MLRIPLQERPHWRQLAAELDFGFHTIDGEPYWDESAYYQFSLQQIEQDIEDPTAEIHQMCLQVVDRVCADDELLRRFAIPESHWDYVRNSWLQRDPSLYSRLDFAYHGQGPAKLYENNADTPTSLYETGFWQWLWLEDQVNAGRLPARTDQFNSVQEKLITRFHQLAGTRPLHFSCCKDSAEDRATVQYLQDCAADAGIPTRFVYIDDIGADPDGHFIDLDDQPIEQLFKLYPWEYLLREPFARLQGMRTTQWLEPAWKSILSNKALLPLLWKMYPHHPNLLPAFFADELHLASECAALVEKPLFSREGANIRIFDNQTDLACTPGPYGEEGFIYQQAHPLPRFGHHYTLIGSWLINDEPAGMGIREDSGLITRDSSRFLPHIILD